MGYRKLSLPPSRLISKRETRMTPWKFRCPVAKAKAAKNQAHLRDVGNLYWLMIGSGLILAKIVFGIVI